MRRRLESCLVLVASLGVGCAPRPMTVTRVVHPEDPALLGIDTFVLGSFTGGEGAVELRDELRARLLHGRHVRLLGDPAEPQPGDGAPAGAGPFADRERSAAMVSARVTRHEYTETLSESDVFPGENGEEHRDYFVAGQATVAVAFTIQDVRTREILSAFTVERTRNHTRVRTDRPPVPPDAADLLRTARGQVVEAVLGRIARHLSIERVRFRTPGNVELTELEPALRDIAAGEHLAALKLFEVMVARHPGEPEVVYNLGFAQALNGLFEDALASFDRAEELDDGKLAPFIERARVDCRRWRRETLTRRAY